ncbi:MAG: calcium/sodium antiporter [Pirellulaceae bacterium]|jgi:cation:H+ antiporter|nr:calcium/sodium antiporter [Pirellulaceae bacterium]
MDLLTLVFFVAGLVALVVGAELLVRGAAHLAAAVGVSPLVIGLTVVAYGTSSPELAVSVQASWLGQADLAMGNVVGSNILNVLLILGASALIIPLSVARQLLRLDVPLMIVLSVATLVFGLDGRIGRLDGAVFVVVLVVYTVFLIRKSRRDVAAERAAERAADPELFAAADGPRFGSIVVDTVLIVVGLGLLILGSRWLVQGAVALATAWGVSELLIGLTIVAIGTSLPEVATTLAAAARGQRDIAVGNVVGSCTFNIISVLGISSLVSREGILVSAQALQFDIPVMIGVAVACLPVFYTGGTISRWEGALFLGYYVAYTVYLILHATGNGALPMFHDAMLWFVIPLTGITLIVHSCYCLRRSRADACGGSQAVARDIDS